MIKYYYPNQLSNQNITAKPNIVCSADCTTLDTGSFKLNLFLCIDIHTNMIIAYKVTKKTISSKQVVDTIKKTITKRIVGAPYQKLILHTDRGTQFSSKVYHQFTKEFQETLIPSMSRENTPTQFHTCLIHQLLKLIRVLINNIL